MILLPVQCRMARAALGLGVRELAAATAYSAIQQSGSGFGSFDCWDCKTEIYHWSAPYIYSDWNEITLTTPNNGETI